MWIEQNVNKSFSKSEQNAMELEQKNRSLHWQVRIHQNGNVSFWITYLNRMEDGKFLAWMEHTRFSFISEHCPVLIWSACDSFLLFEHSLSIVLPTRVDYEWKGFFCTYTICMVSVERFLHNNSQYNFLLTVQFVWPFFWSQGAEYRSSFEAIIDNAAHDIHYV